MKQKIPLIVYYNMTAEAFVSLIIKIKDRLFRLAYQMLGNSAEAEDAVQEVIYRVWLKNHMLQNLNNPDAYVMTALRNFCLDRLKTKASHTRITSSNQVKSEDSPYLKLERTNEQYHLLRLIQDLPEQQRTILWLRDVEEMEYSEIEKIMNMHATTVRVNLSRARKYLRERITALHNFGNHVD